MFTWLAWLLLGITTFVGATSNNRILSATYGIAGCLGVDTSNLTDLRARGCAVTTDGKTSARSVLQMRAFCGLQSLEPVENADGMPITFSAPVQKSTVKPEHFLVTLNHGARTKPLCVSSNPAGEGNELQTFALAGHFGDGWKDTTYPVQVSIVGDIRFEDGSSASGLSFNISAGERFTQDTAFLVQADLLEFSTVGEALLSIQRTVYPNHCAHLYGSSVTHRLRIVLNGGGTIDGVHSVLPNQTDLFQLLDRDGHQIVAPILGLADLGSSTGTAAGDTPFTYAHDGDNFYDVCLDASKGGVDQIATVRMPCETVWLVLPKGGPKCTANSIAVGNESKW